MAKSKFFGFLGKAAKFVAEKVIPGAGVAGVLAANAAKLIKQKQSPEQKAKDAAEAEKAAIKKAAEIGTALGGGSKFSIIMGNVIDFLKKYWWVVLPIVFILIYFLFFKKKSRVIRRAHHRASASHLRRSPVKRRSSTHRSKGRLTGSAFVRRMRLAKLKKARSRKK